MYIIYIYVYAWASKLGSKGHSYLPRAAYALHVQVHELAS